MYIQVMKTVRMWMIGLMILKTLKGDLETLTANSSLIGCEFEFDACIIRLPRVEAKFSLSV